MAVTQYQDIGVAQTDGMRICNAATQKEGFYGAAPVVQQAYVANATDAATAITCAAACRLALINIGIMASS